MMKAKSVSCAKDHTCDPHKQVMGKGGVTNKQNAGARPHNLAKIDLQRRSKKAPATGI